MAKTIAHELGHYLMNEGDSAHVTDVWNLMKEGGEERKRDLRDAQIDAARSSGVTPQQPDGSP